MDGDRPADSGCYLDVCPDNCLSPHLDCYFDSLTSMGIPVERVHHECAPGQVEVEIDYDSVLHQADRLVSSKLAIRALAKLAGLRATFMPKPIAGMAGSGMHVHFRLLDGDTNLFGGEGGLLSKTGLHFIAGLLDHAPALTAVCNPSVNSYKRLVPNHEAPVYITWGYRNRSALVRVPLAPTPQKTALEFRSPDATTNVHLALAAMVAAGMDGVRRGPGTAGRAPRERLSAHSRAAQETQGEGSSRRTCATRWKPWSETMSSWPPWDRPSPPNSSPRIGRNGTSTCTRS